jgi:dodecin
MTENITRGAIKVIEVIGVSDSSWEDAAHQAVAKAAETIDGITGVEVLRWTARISEGRIVQYSADVKLAFVVR